MQRIFGDRISAGYRIAATAVAALVLLQTAGVALADRGDELQDQLDASKGRLNLTKSQIDANEAQQNGLVREILDLDKKINATEGEINRLTNELNKTIAEKSKTETELASLKAELENTLKELEAAKKRLARQKSIFNRRIRSIYKNGTITYLAVVLNSKSFGDFINRLSFLSLVAFQDSELVRQIALAKSEIEVKEGRQRAQKSAIEAKRLALLNDERRITDLKSQQESQKAALESDKAAHQALVARLQQDQKALQAAYDKEEATSQQIAANLDAWRAQAAALAKARAEAEAKARAEAQAQASAQARASSPPTPGISSAGSAQAAPAPQYSPAPATEPAPAPAPAPPPEPAPSSGWVWPAGTMADITSGFGWRSAPTAGASSFHEGVDIAVDYDTPVVAARSGTVIFAGYDGGFGNFVVIDHGDGLSSSYAHLDYFVVSVGDYVRAGQVIAYSGSTGVSTGPHLDFRIYVDGVAQNPLNWY